MAVNVTSGHGVNLRTKIIDASGREVTSAAKAASDLTHKIEVIWRYATRSADVRITSNIVQNASVVQHQSGAPWLVTFANVQGSNARTDSDALTVSPSKTGQVVIDCGTIEVLDVWNGGWATETLSAQLMLTVS